MIKLKSNKNNINIVVEAIEMGNDLCVAITGGDTPHLGAVAVGIPVKSHSDSKKLSSTVSVITLPEHKEDEIVKPVANILAKTLNKKVVVSCGIHIDNICYRDIEIIISKVNEMIIELVDIVKKKIR